jgi:hypothetical protein
MQLDPHMRIPEGHAHAPPGVAHVVPPVQSELVQHDADAIQLDAHRRVPLAQPHVPAVHVSPLAQVLTQAPLEHV